MPSFSLQDYLKRINISGNVSPDLETLQRIQYAHATAIPFENLTPLMAQPVSLEMEHIVQKLVHDGRGGYCFEHDILLMTALKAIGFHVHGLIARVVWTQTETPMPRTHMALRVMIDGQDYIADTGFGRVTLTSPLKLECDIAQQTRHEDFRLVRVGEVFEQQAYLNGKWKPCYQFDLQSQELIDYHLPNYYLYSTPTTHFRTSLICARPANEGRYTLVDTRFTFHPRQGEAQITELNTLDAMKNVLKEHFLIRLPEDAELDAALTKLIRQKEEENA